MNIAGESLCWGLSAEVETPLPMAFYTAEKAIYLYCKWETYLQRDVFGVQENNLRSKL